MNNQELNNILQTIRALPDGNDEMARAVLKAAVDSVTLETLQKLLPTAKATTDKKVVGNGTKGEGSTGSLKFTKKEIDAMSEPIKILLIYSGYEIRYRMIKNTYQVRFRRDGYNIELCAKDLTTLKAKFLNAVEKAIPHKKSVTPLLKDYINEWVAIKKTTVKESTMAGYMDMINKHILPIFGDKHLDEITRADVQNYLSDLVNKGRFRTAEKLKIQLKAILDVAVADYNFKSPMAMVELPNYEIKKGKSLTIAEEKTVVDYCIEHKEEPASGAILILLYTGMRVGELKTATLHENYIECETEKVRKGKAREFRKIPISPMLRRVMEYINFEVAKTAKRDYINARFKKILAGRHTHELRYTFITRAKEQVQNGT